MELLQGESLTASLARCGRLPPEIACELARQVASALGAAHRADVLHRDLKPDNIYLVPDPAVPAGERVKVIDFGLAKLGRHGHTISNTIFGTPRYMSPEQCRSSGEIDQRSDVYALGCVLFELVTGQTPFDGDLRQLVQRHQHAAPPRARSFAPELPQELDDLIAHMLAKDPAARPQTMGAVQRALRAVGALLADGPPTLIPNRASRLALGATEPLAAPKTPGSGPKDFDISDAGPQDNDTDLDAEIIVPAPRPVPRRNPALMLPLPPEGRRRRRGHAFVTAAVALVIAGLLVTLITREVTRASPDEVPAAVPSRRAP
jgi:serine/threonine protein kinase